MKRVLVLLLSFLCFHVADAGSIAKRYKTFLTESGTLYFVRPMHMPKCDGNQTRYGMTFDITYLANDEDSVSFTATIVSPVPVASDTVSIETSRERLKAKIERIYCEPYKSYYVNRLRFYIKWSDWKMLYQQDRAYVVCFEEKQKYVFGNKHWKSERDIMNGILNIIELNK